PQPSSWFFFAQLVLPTNIKEIVGQAGAASNVTKLMNWLSKWYMSHDGKKKAQRPNPWANKRRW
ncbi:GL13171, partial [Drosophila persimilis]